LAEILPPLLESWSNLEKAYFLEASDCRNPYWGFHWDQRYLLEECIKELIPLGDKVIY